MEGQKNNRYNNKYVTSSAHKLLTSPNKNFNFGKTCSIINPLFCPNINPDRLFKFRTIR